MANIPDWMNPYKWGQSIGSWLVNSAGGANNLGNLLNGQSSLDAQYAKQLALQEQAQGYNSAEAQKDRDWQEHMSNTSYQRMMADLEAAGINPMMAFANGSMAGASTPSGSAASSSATSVGSRKENWQSLVSAAPVIPLPTN